MCVTSYLTRLRNRMSVHGFSETLEIDPFVYSTFSVFEDTYPYCQGFLDIFFRWIHIYSIKNIYKSETFHYFPRKNSLYLLYYCGCLHGKKNFFICTLYTHTNSWLSKVSFDLTIWIYFRYWFPSNRLCDCLHRWN